MSRGGVTRGPVASRRPERGASRRRAALRLRGGGGDAGARAKAALDAVAGLTATPLGSIAFVARYAGRVPNVAAPWRYMLFVRSVERAHS